ncbi:MAG: aminotransferase class IV [Chthoniobacter sp.]
MNYQKPAQHWIDGKLVREDLAVLPVTDLVITRGYGAFEALRTYAGKPFLLEEHLRRFEKTCIHMNLRCPLNRKELAKAAIQTLKANSFPESLVRFYVTGGDAHRFLPEGQERLMILIGAHKEPAAWQYESGIAIKTTTLTRQIPLAKTVDYSAGIRETILANRQGYQEVAYLDRRGCLLEGTTFSIFALLGKTLVTPEEGVLPGCTAAQVIKLARRAGFTIQRSAISPAMLKKASELFITSTTRELLPVVRVDQQQIGAGVPGPVTRVLHQRFRKSAAAAVKRLS